MKRKRKIGPERTRGRRGIADPRDIRGRRDMRGRLHALDRLNITPHLLDGRPDFTPPLREGRFIPYILEDPIDNRAPPEMQGGATEDRDAM